MSLFKRNQSSDDAVRCPNCHERVPEGERACTMCGHSLTDTPDDQARSDAADANTAPHH
jgi:rRNA maturation endonuclease Nob1